MERRRLTARVQTLRLRGSSKITAYRMESELTKMNAP